MSNRGAFAEDAAAQYLCARGLHLVERNYRCRFGEIDLILRDGDVLVFVEVRYRAGEAFGGAAESITATKREKLLRTARHYISSRRGFFSCRFDAVLLNGDISRIEWIVNAFGE